MATSIASTSDYLASKRTLLSVPPFTSEQMLLLLAQRVVAAAAAEGVVLDADEALAELSVRRDEAIADYVEEGLNGF